MVAWSMGQTDGLVKYYGREIFDWMDPRPTIRTALTDPSPSLKPRATLSQKTLSSRLLRLLLGEERPGEGREAEERHRWSRRWKMVKLYHRYKPSLAFGVIASLEANICYDGSGKLLLSPALEQLGLWNLRQGVCAKNLCASSEAPSPALAITFVASSPSSVSPHLSPRELYSSISSSPSDSQGINLF